MKRLYLEHLGPHGWEEFWLTRDVSQGLVRDKEGQRQVKKSLRNDVIDQARFVASLFQLAA